MTSDRVQRNHLKRGRHGNESEKSEGETQSKRGCMHGAKAKRETRCSTKRGREKLIINTKIERGGHT